MGNDERERREKIVWRGRASGGDALVLQIGGWAASIGRISATGSRSKSTDEGKKRKR